MTRLSIALVCCLGLSACVSLPGADSSPSARYTLPASTASCTASEKVLELSVVAVAPGLDNNRIARVNRDSGKLSYLKGVRWADSSASLVEQRLAADLECAGYTVSTSHRSNIKHPRLVCELRAFNLAESRSGGDSAEVALSCLLSGTDGELSLTGSATEDVNSWNADAAVAGVGRAYTSTLRQISKNLP